MMSIISVDTSSTKHKKNKQATSTISIIMPCYNNVWYVAQAIESVQNQAYSNWELIIVNDGSIDNSDIVINRYAHADTHLMH